MRMSSYSMMFDSMSNLDIALVKLQAQTEKAIEKATRAASFADTLAALQSADATQETAAETKSTADMTMDEYKAYLSEKLAAIPWHPNRYNDEESITITDAGWERLKNDPEYEKWLLDHITTDRSFYSPLLGTGGTYCTRTIGATKEEYQGWSWSKQYGFGSAAKSRSVFEEKSKDSQMKIRAKKKKLQAEAEEKYYAEKRMLEKMSEQLAAIRTARAKQAGLMHTASDIPIFGVPAEFLLAGLGGGMGGMSGGL
ncbi:MAG: hypothetical protein IJ631_04445 [Schwartzia sp.]|nr:hypothetical protein [Schwartzia sp. (in: firmicutes)]